MIETLRYYWPHLLGALAILLAVAVSVQVLLMKRNAGAAVAWIGLVWLSPFAGAFIYLLFGINRIRRRAYRLRPGAAETSYGAATSHVVTPRDLAASLPMSSRHIAEMAHLPERLGAPGLLAGNRVTALVGGATAYRAMVDAIDRAERSVALSSYIFNNDRAGGLFIAALERAKDRGLEVRVLIDGVGALYAWPSTVTELRRRGIMVDRFLYSLVPLRMPYLNLRNHQKILVVDGRVGFTGGLNIREAYLDNGKSGPLGDLQFRFEGPVVAQMMETFAREWSFTNGEALTGETWFPPLVPRGQVMARGIASGPDEAEDRIHWTMLTALTTARRSVTILTPYFLPDEPLEVALELAALRGLAVDIILPAESNLPFIGWASAMSLEVLLRSGCRVWLSPPPFDHSKLLLIDDAWAFLGSANWDPRSFRLNFEFNVECYDPGLAKQLRDLSEERRQKSRFLSLQDMARRGPSRKLRDGLARLFTPYL